MSINKLGKEKEKAKRVITEIVRQSLNDQFLGKTRLYKAFYFAHLFYAKECGMNLTEWPIVRMPNGPGIDQFDQLMNELANEGVLKVASDQFGPYPSNRYELIATHVDPLQPEDEIAIKKAVAFVNNKTATELSELTHEYSKSWNNAANGDELNIYVDLLSDDEYKDLRERQDSVADALSAVWN